MGKLYEDLDPVRSFVEAQHVFFVATAPAGAEGHVNCSPKGYDSLRILGPRTVAYLDYAGSGAETIAHVRENGRIVFLFCAFDGPPKTVRLHGRGRVLEPCDPDFEEHLARFDPGPGVRSIVRVEVERVSDSCGYGVPRYRYKGDRKQLREYSAHKGPEGMIEFQRKTSLRSIDGLPALRGLSPSDGSPG